MFINPHAQGEMTDCQFEADVALMNDDENDPENGVLFARGRDDMIARLQQVPSQYWHDLLWSNWGNNLSSSYTQYQNQGFREVLNAVWPNASWVLGGNQTLIPEWIGGPAWTANMQGASLGQELV